MGYGFGFKKPPDERVIDFSQAIMRSADGGYCPWEGFVMSVSAGCGVRKLEDRFAASTAEPQQSWYHI